MSRVAALCILEIFRFARVFIRMNYTVFESACEFACTVLYGYLSEVDATVTTAVGHQERQNLPPNKVKIFKPNKLEDSAAENSSGKLKHDRSQRIIKTKAFSKCDNKEMFPTVSQESKISLTSVDHYKCNKIDSKLDKDGKVILSYEFAANRNEDNSGRSMDTIDASCKTLTYEATSGDICKINRKDQRESCLNMKIAKSSKDLKLVSESLCSAISAASIESSVINPTVDVSGTKIKKLNEETRYSTSTPLDQNVNRTAQDCFKGQSALQKEPNENYVESISRDTLEKVLVKGSEAETLPTASRIDVNTMLNVTLQEKTILPSPRESFPETYSETISPDDVPLLIDVPVVRNLDVDFDKSDTDGEYIKDENTSEKEIDRASKQMLKYLALKEFHEAHDEAERRRRKSCPYDLLKYLTKSCVNEDSCLKGSTISDDSSVVTSTCDVTSAVLMLEQASVSGHCREVAHATEEIEVDSNLENVINPQTMEPRKLINEPSCDFKHDFPLETRPDNSPLKKKNKPKRKRKSPKKFENPIPKNTTTTLESDLPENKSTADSDIIFEDEQTKDAQHNE